jgi:TolB-like protein/DNA-binding winged helix-turn-helix (wHTH) protein/Flp pilus assembly protein TadD
MKGTDDSALRIGAWRVDPTLDEISKDGSTVKLERRAMQLLLCLAEHTSQVVSVEQLLDEVWTGVVVTPDSVYHAVAALRRMLGDDSHDPAYIANVPRRGYRLVAPVAPWIEAPNVPVEGAPSPTVEPARATLAVPSTGLPWRRYAIVLFIVLTIALGYVVVNRFWLSQPITSEHSAVTASNNVFDQSIAVLPFVDMSETKDQEYFADGMAEEILDLLATIPALKVIGRTSSFQFKGKNEDLRAIGAKLGVAYLLEGSVRKSGNRVRVTAQLLDSQDGAHRWSGTYDRDIGDVLKMQEEIAAGIVRALQIAVGADDLPARAALGNSEAYNLYLRGRYALTRFDKKGFDEAGRDFQQALDLDPTSAITEAYLSFSFLLQGEWGYVAPGVAAEQARRAAKSALQRDSTLTLPHQVLGAIHTSYDYDWAAADKEIQRALALAPYDALATFFAARLSMSVGRWDEALTELNASLAQEPLSAGFYQVLDWIQARRGRLPEAEAAARRLLEISPTYDSAHYFLGLILIERGERDAALLEMQQETGEEAQQAGLAMAYHALGRNADSDAALARMIKEHANYFPFMIAEAHAFRGEPDQAFKWLDRAYAQKDPMLYFIKGELPLKNLVSDPRYKAFLRKMDLPE